MYFILKVCINPAKIPLTSIDQGIALSEYIAEKKVLPAEIIVQGIIKERFGDKIKILSQNKAKMSKLLESWKKNSPDLKTAACLMPMKKCKSA